MTFARLLDLYRRPDGSRWGGQSLENASGGAVTRSYVSNFKEGRIGNPGIDKLGAIAGAIGFPPGLWFEEAEISTDEALLATLHDPTARSIVEEIVRLSPDNRILLLGVARGISSTAGRS